MTVRGVVTQELERITAENDGVLTAEQVVAEARPKNSPLHHLFEWDNKVAGDKWRVYQARTLIRIVREEIGTDENEQPQYVRVYTAARDAGREEPGYLKTRDIVASPISEAIMLKQLKREIGRLQQKYGHLKEFGAIVRGELGELAV